MSDFKQIGIGEPNDPIIGSKAMKGRRWQIDPDGSGKAFPKIIHPTKPTKSLPYSKFYEMIQRVVNEVLTEESTTIKYKDFYSDLTETNDSVVNLDRGLEVNKTDHTIDDDHTKDAIRPLNKQSQSPVAIG